MKQASAAVWRPRPLEVLCSCNLLRTQLHLFLLALLDSPNSAKGLSQVLFHVGLDTDKTDLADAGELRGCKVLELGAGTGMAGICAALLGADVTLTDTASCMPLLMQNVDSHCSHILHAGRQSTILLIL